MLSAIVNKWAEANPEAAAGWVDRANLRDHLAGWEAIWAQHSPVQAATYVASLPPRESRAQSVLSVVSAWAYRDPESTAAWIERFPESELRNRAVEELLVPWAANHAARAQSWARTLSLDPSSK
jgi:hypothetical protein